MLAQTQDEFYAVAFRKKLYHTLEELQVDLDKWIEIYNHERTHTGKYCFGRTPYQTFQEAKQLAKDKMLETLFQKEDVVIESESDFTPQVVR